MVRSTLLCLCVRVALRGKELFQRKVMYQCQKVKICPVTSSQNCKNQIPRVFSVKIDGLKAKFAQEVFAYFVISLPYVPEFDKK